MTRFYNMQQFVYHLKVLTDFYQKPKYSVLLRTY